MVVVVGDVGEKELKARVRTCASNSQDRPEVPRALQILHSTGPSLDSQTGILCSTILYIDISSYIVRHIIHSLYRANIWLTVDESTSMI